MVGTESGEINFDECHAVVEFFSCANLLARGI